MSFTIENITTENLTLMKLGGYKKEEVDDLIDVIRTEYAKVIMLLEKANSYRKKAEQFDENYSEIQDALVVAQRSKKQTIAEAQLEAQRILKEAQLSAAQTKNDATRQANEIANEVKSDTASMIENAKRTAQEILDDAQVTSRKILNKIDQERETHKEARRQIKVLTSMLSEVLNQDEWLDVPLATKSASLKPAEPETPKKSDKVEETQTKSKTAAQPDASNVFGEQQMSQAQLDALASLQKTSDAIQQELIKPRQKIETPQQAQNLLDRLKNSTDRE